MSSPLPAVLSFAASDPTGGAGLQADLLTIAALGCHALTVLTGYTAQDTRGVERLDALAPADIERQARCILDDIPVSAFKLGVLGSARNVNAIAKILAAHPGIPVVLDPVLASGRGDPLADAGTVQALRDAILPLVTIATPNTMEIRRLALACPDAAIPDCVRNLIALGCGHVLVTGTHEGEGPVVNALYGKSGALREDRWPRLPGEYHGSGCTLSASLATHLAKGADLSTAAHAAQAYTWKTLQAGFQPGRGQAIPDRFFDRR